LNTSCDGDVELRSILEKKSEALLQKDLLLEEMMKKSSQGDQKLEAMRKEFSDQKSLLTSAQSSIDQMTKELTEKKNENVILKKSVKNLREQIEEIDEMRDQLNEYKSLVNEKDAEIEAFQETNVQLTMLLRQLEEEKKGLKEHVTRLEDLLKQQKEGEVSGSRKYVEEIGELMKKMKTLQNDKDQMMMSLKHKQKETQKNQEELKRYEDKQMKQDEELKRLRTHLLQVEESYTLEAVTSEKREEDLINQVRKLTEKMAKFDEVKDEKEVEIEKLRNNLNEIILQRNHTVQQFHLAQEKSQQLSSALSQLKTAAERMQREEAATYSAQLDKIKLKLKMKEDEVGEKDQELQRVKIKMEEVSDALQLASRLSEQLENKESELEDTRIFVSEKESQIECLETQIKEIQSNNENSLDRQLVKNLFIGYFSSPVNKRDDVTRLITSVVGFSKEDMQKLNPPRKTWGFLSWSAPVERKDDDQSFTDLFVKFLEEESQSRQVVKLPANQMIKETLNRRKTSSLPTPAETSTNQRGTVAGRYNPPIVIPNPITIMTPSQSASHPFTQPASFSPLVQASSSNHQQNILKGILQNP